MAKKRKLLNKSIEVLFRGDVEDILSKRVSPFKSLSHIKLPKKYKGRKVKIIIYK